MNALEMEGMAALRRRAVARYERDGLTLMVFPDGSPENPREWDNLFTFAFRPNDRFAGDLGGAEFDRAIAPGARRKLADRGGLAVPVLAYVHSGVSFGLDPARYPFNDRWDAGCCGYALAGAKRIRRRCGGAADDPAAAARAVAILRGELLAYEQYLGGDVYGYRVFDGAWTELSSCWGFYGDDFAGNGLLESAGFPASAAGSAP